MSTDVFRPWVPVAQETMPSLGNIVEIDVGNVDQSSIHRAVLALDATGHYWVLEGSQKRLAEPRIINRLAAGQVWRWRATEPEPAPNPLKRKPMVRPSSTHHR